ncbi:hypothetical protein GBA52_015197 [Prunus armeniaca]|nr:hypothetical protein GBA52_015197 [Prunus armeniaca]
MEREKGEGCVNTNAQIGSQTRERTCLILNKIESWIRLKTAGKRRLGPGDLLLLAQFVVCTSVPLLGVRSAQ